LRESFVLFDTNGDGFIDGPELKAAMKNFYALELTDADVEEMIAEADQDGNKKIDFNEFKTMMTAISQPAK
jgi:Ca2+-binding EF-hand superfamily protein